MKTSTIAKLSAFESDHFDTPAGPLKITFIGHGTLMLEWAGTVIHIDPVGQFADYAKLTKADLILVTHQHSDHLDPGAIEKIENPKTEIILNPSSAEMLRKGTRISNGQSRDFKDIHIEAVPAYNTTPGRDKFHPKGRDNGYILSSKGFRIYIAGDTEVIPEMKNISAIDIAFFPMNQPYTMTPAQAAELARIIRPAVLYPYHFGETRAEELAELLKDEKAIEVRIRKLQ
jgi:L-ascorbate metabolism protein UlaG (beta-lactamase superfamily)